MPIGELTAVTLDCPDPAALADFYKEVLGLDVVYSDESAVYLGGTGTSLGFQKVEGYQKPSWPSQSAPQQIHLDVVVQDLDKAESNLVELGAEKAGDQPMPDYWRVLLDPAGHPFCIALPQG